MVKKTGECCSSGGEQKSCCMPHSGGVRRCKGMLMLLLGIVFLLGTLGYVPDLTFAKYWPVFLIVLGLHGFCPCHNNCKK
ncbi:hypothetical protein COY05_05045 [Candidatus Peregrinibacteria bacterium CG_4_10_14_0_2_um_filter_38_24]|nr:MAG: hypothetical protein COY05_05045 [Candidatus Peregrinibacteria bacterium CG_4_10_14_0_2_um_filter_38_24]PJC39362.1 MAG: hypothetical protein CO044_00195 [Candidatus Peregrinibacteria bacterium CG_4_9_14_0_2_um_filter_38_9]